jgi:hypothetical protein
MNPGLELDAAEMAELEDKAAYVVAGFQKSLSCCITGSYVCCAARSWKHKPREGEVEDNRSSTQRKAREMRR